MPPGPSSPNQSGGAVNSARPAAFIVGTLVVQYLLNFVSRHGFSFFAHWRIFVGAVGLWGLLLFK